MASQTIQTAPSRHHSPPHGREVLPLGPDSLTWRLFGDWRSVLLVLRTGTLQAMHPAIAAALVEHSDVFENPWDRLLRSAPQILETVYGSDPLATGARIRDYHRPVNGTDAEGRSYRALDPDTYFWAHATFFESQIATAELFGDSLSEPEKQRLYAESLDWYACYGVTARPAPSDYAAFRSYWERVVEQVLEPTEVACWTFAEVKRWPAPFAWMDGPLWLLLRRPVGGGLAWIARGALGPVVRERLDLQWSPAEERLLHGLGRGVRCLWRVLPGDLGMARTARAAYRRERRTAPPRPLGLPGMTGPVIRFLSRLTLR
jgi:uncharacterized protein (DUF2236 family)